MVSASSVNREHLIWKTVPVDGRTAVYGVAGEPDGIPVLFLHGWALAHHSYKRPMKRLVQLGCRVYAPALPGFGGTPDLRGSQFTFAGYAGWVSRFLEAIEVDDPVIAVGHSFGGAVSIKLAHDHPERVSSLVLINSVGGATWTDNGSLVKALADRPLWDWGIHFPGDVLPLPHVTRVLPVVAGDLVNNFARNPLGVWRVANLVRKADLKPKLEALKVRGLPCVVLWGAGDKIIPRASFEALCEAIGSEGQVIKGNHSWMLSDPDAFGEVMTNVVEVARLARAAEEQGAARGGLRRLIRRQATHGRDTAALG